ncbi:MAG TPA: hypothetical protein VM537_03840 [Anaerolineae bacterium]|nr:hypothetical protein [Anaerolineae bacterium]
MPTPVPHLFFGNAWAWFPKGHPQNWQRRVSMRRRPEEDGADIIRGGLEPVKWAMQVRLLMADILSAETMIRRWEALAGQVADLHMLVDIPWHFGGVCLFAVNLAKGPIKVEAATDGTTQYMVWLDLIFAHVVAATPVV